MADNLVELRGYRSAAWLAARKARNSAANSAESTGTSMVAWKDESTAVRSGDLKVAKTDTNSVGLTAHCLAEQTVRNSADNSVPNLAEH